MKEHFGEQLKKLRKNALLTQSQFAEKLNVHLQTVSKWERGISEPDISLLGDIADCLNIPLEKLLGQKQYDETYSGKFDVLAFGRAIADARKRLGKSQEELAQMNKSYIILRMYDILKSGGGIKITECCGEYAISLSTFRRYIAFLREYFEEIYAKEIVYDPGTEIYRLR